MTVREGSDGWALVLGPGGPVGTAWLTGLAAGLRRAGADPAAADLIVGTSAGAIAGALITTGRDLDALAELPPRDRRHPAVDGPLIAEALALHGVPDLAPDAIRHRIQRLSLATEALPAQQHRAGMQLLIGTDEWPAGRLLVTAVDAESGEPVVWDASSGVPLTAAVAASSAAPGYAEPVAIGGRHYMDGALGGGSNAHLAAGAGPVVLVEPLPQTPDECGWCAESSPHVEPDECGWCGGSSPPEGPNGSEDGWFRAGDGSGADVRIVPDEAAQAAFGASVDDLTRWTPVYREGFRQAADVARRIGPAIGVRAR